MADIGKMALGMGAAIIVSFAVPALAQERAVRASHAAIAVGDLTRAERTLVAELRIHPNRPEVLLNLAAIYARSGRPALATEVYGKVLANEDVLMDLSDDRTVSAHALARVGMAKLDRQVAAR